MVFMTKACDRWTLVHVRRLSRSHCLGAKMSMGDLSVTDTETCEKDSVTTEGLAGQELGVVVIIIISCF